MKHTLLDFRKENSKHAKLVRGAQYLKNASRKILSCYHKEHIAVLVMCVDRNEATTNTTLKQK